MSEGKLEVIYGECDNCGSSLVGPEEIYDGHTFICDECKMIHWLSADEDTWFINTEGEFYTPIDERNNFR